MVARHAEARSADAEPDPAAVAVRSGLATRSGDHSVLFAPPSGGPPGASVLREPTDAPVTTATTVPTPSPIGGADPSPTNLAAMADELYDRIERRLRLDLMLERERRGSLADR